MVRSRQIGTLGLWLVIIAGCASNSTASRSPAPQPNPSRAEDARPLRVGQSAPTQTVLTPEGEPFDLGRAYRERATMIIFYRGGWCPYCNAHLGETAEAEPKLLDSGLQILAVSADRSEELKKSVANEALTYQLLSDSDMTLARKFGVAFQVDDATVEKYRGFGIDLERSSGRSHHVLPVPAVFIIDQRGVIRFSHWNPDYKSRLSAEELIAAAQEVARAQ